MSEKWRMQKQSRAPRRAGIPGQIEMQVGCDGGSRMVANTRLVEDMRKVVTFVTPTINYTEKLQPRTKKIKTIVEQAVRYLGLTGLTCKNVQDDHNKTENQSSQESCIG